MAGRSLVWNKFFSKEKRTVLEALKQVSIFDSLETRHLREIERIGYLLSFEKEEMIFYRNDPSFGFFILLEGEVEIFVGKKKIVKFRPIDIFGQFSLIKGNTRSANARALKRAKVFYIYADHLKRLFREYPEMGLRIYEQMLKMFSVLIEDYDRKLAGK